MNTSYNNTHIPNQRRSDYHSLSDTVVSRTLGKLYKLYNTSLHVRKGLCRKFVMHFFTWSDVMTEMLFTRSTSDVLVGAEIHD